MGIDIYAQWDGQTDEEEKAQYCGFKVDQGGIGYLREAYHGGPYATKKLVPEAFDAEGGECRIPAALMRERLPEVIFFAKTRGLRVYGERYHDSSPEIRSFIDFVELCERKEAETGQPVMIIASY